MAVQADQIVQHTVEHVLAVLRAAPAAPLPPGTQFGEHIPSLISQLPFITVTAEAVPGRRSGAGPTGLRSGIGGTLDLKRGTPKTAPPNQPSPADVDWGYVSGSLQPCRCTLTLWAVTRPQLDRLRRCAVEIDWLGSGDWTGQDKVHDWVDPPGTRNRTSFAQCRLDRVFPASTTALPVSPPIITVTKNNTGLRSAPLAGAAEVGTADVGAQFELLGRSADAQWVQGAWGTDRAVWIKVDGVDSSVPLPWVPVAEGTGQAPAAPVHAAAGAPAGTGVWRQDLEYSAVLELRQEPIAEEGERIVEVRITRKLGAGDLILDVERTRLLADREEAVEEFPQ